METLEWLQNWYGQNCDGDWEDLYGAEIHTADNLDWAVKIDLADTAEEDKVFNELDYKNGDSDWMHCFVKNDKFQGRGDVKKLKEILTVFKDWVES